MEEYDGIIHEILVEIAERWRIKAAGAAAASLTGRRRDWPENDDLEETVIISADTGMKGPSSPDGDCMSFGDPTTMGGATQTFAEEKQPAEKVDRTEEGEEEDSLEETVIIRLSDVSKAKKEGR